jgi:hypothetical protein
MRRRSNPCCFARSATLRFGRESAIKQALIRARTASWALQARPNDLIADLKTFGFLFESLVERDLRIYAQNLDGEISHYHYESGLEADAIVHLSDGRWGAIEIKLGGNLIDDAATNLIKLKEKVAERKESSFLMVITGTLYAYKRPDGVLVVPIGCLKD